MEKYKPLNEKSKLQLPGASKLKGNTKSEIYTLGDYVNLEIDESGKFTFILDGKPLIDGTLDNEEVSSNSKLNIKTLSAFIRRLDK